MKTGEEPEQPTATSSTCGTSDGQNRRKRLQLSCGECRKKKLLCDRNLPCQRCVRTGRPEQCSFETRRGQPPVLNSQLVQQQAQRHSHEIRVLQAEVAHLKGLLSKPHMQHVNDNNPGDIVHITGNSESGLAGKLIEKTEQSEPSAITTDAVLSDPRERSPHGYYSQHTLFQFFREIPQLFPFIKETTDQWLKPLGVDLKKNKAPKHDYRLDATAPEENPLEILLPSKDDADALILIYLENFEQLHHIVHIPTFKREYASFWVPGRTRYPAMTALILSMVSISTCTDGSSSDYTSIPSRYRIMSVQWVSACDEWLRQQSSKNAKLVHYQISCLLCIAKRINIIRKKRHWKETGSLIQNAIMDGLHHDSFPIVDSPYMREMKRRIWAVLRELELQSVFEYGLPTLLYSIDSNTANPINIDDEEFDEGSKVFPSAKPPNQYTLMSYQYHSSRSWALRLEISRHLFNTGTSKALSYDDVLRYTQEVSQAIQSLPSWDKEEAQIESSPNMQILTYAFLSFQLQECILAIHRPFLKKDNNKFWVSENICYQISRDMLLLNCKLARLGIQSLTVLREDLLLASLSLTRITLLQPKDSTSIIITNAESATDLLEQCLPFIEDRYLRCFYGEPWCFMTMCAAIMLLKTHLGKESWQTAKSSCARRFLDLHYRHIARQQPHPQSQDPAVPTDTLATNQQIDLPDAAAFPTSEWLDSRYPDIGIDFLDLDMDLDGVWESWEPA